MKSILLIAALSIITISQANAYNVRGTPDCGVWIKDQQSSKPDNMPWGNIVNKAWLLGFLSGLNADGRSGNFLKKASNEQIYLWTDNYCKAHPLKDLADAGETLAVELINKK